jgi:hypothetical protein
MSGLLSVPLRAGQHLAIWLIWQATGYSHLADASVAGGSGVRVIDSSSQVA